jgi:hypothetical protein
MLNRTKTGLLIVCNYQALASFVEQSLKINTEHTEIVGSIFQFFFPFFPLLPVFSVFSLLTVTKTALAIRGTI